LKDRSRFFDIARGSALECAAIHDILKVCRAIDVDDNLTGKSQLRRIVAMLTKLVALNESVSETLSGYQTAFEHRFAEHEHELAIRRIFGVEKSGDASKLVISLRNQEVGGHPHG
jgi:hypothetical protein